MKKFLIVVTVLLFTCSLINAQEMESEETSADESAIEENIETQVEEEAVETVKEVVENEAEAKKEEKVQPKSAQEYIADLSSDDEEKIVAAADWAATEKEKTAVPQLIKLLKEDERPKVRVYATIALGLIADESCIPALNEALTGDSNADVRYSVLLAIHRIDPSKSIDALKKAKESETDPFMKDYMEKMEKKIKEE
ncbi:MAG: HEAT repeat domain-containing protein [Spirochaetes bacterium]|nr:HEAT repeat domain-containing protein [Spirochaetota bacterium]